MSCRSELGWAPRVGRRYGCVAGVNDREWRHYIPGLVGPPSAISLNQLWPVADPLET